MILPSKRACVAHKIIRSNCETIVNIQIEGLMIDREIRIVLIQRQCAICTSMDTLGIVYSMLIAQLEVSTMLRSDANSLLEWVSLSTLSIGNVRRLGCVPIDECQVAKSIAKIIACSSLKMLEIPAVNVV